MEWLPIESAPADREIIVACEYGACTAICVAGRYWYLQAGGHQPTSLYEDCYPVQWPTHWMPLPPTPDRSGEADKTENTGLARRARAGLRPKSSSHHLEKD